MGISVGSISVGMNVDLAEFQSGMQKATNLARSNVTNMSAEMKRQSREGAEGFRLVDEAIGLHLSRPITKLLTQEFPALAQAMKSAINIALPAAVAVAGFEFISHAIEGIERASEAARKKQEEFAAATADLNTKLATETNNAAQNMDRIRERLAELNGDEAGALAAKLRIISREDAVQAIRAIDAISEAYEKNARAAAAAATLSATFWNEVHKLDTSPYDLGVEKINKQTEEIRRTFSEIVLSDPTKGMQNGLGYLQDQLAEAKKTLSEMQSNQISTAGKYGTELTFTDGILARMGAKTKEEVQAQRDVVSNLQKQVDLFQKLSGVDQGNKKVAVAEDAQKEGIGERLTEKLKAETAADLALAAAVGQTVAAQKLQQASGEADQIISRILEEAHGRLTQKMKEELLTIHALTAERQVAKDAIQTNQDLQKQSEAMDRQIESNRALAAAYLQNGEAIESAKIDERLAAQIQKARDLRNEYNALEKAAADYAAGVKTLGGAAGPVQGLNVSGSALSSLKAAADQADREVSDLRQKALADDQARYRAEINSTTQALAGEQPLLDRLNDAYGQSAEAVRHAQIALSLFHWEQAHPGATADQVQAVSAQLEQQSLIARQSADVQLASRYLIVKSYDDELARLQRAREYIQQYGQSTLAIDAAIYEERQRSLQQWDDAALKVGTFAEKYRAVMNELVIQGRDAGAEISKAFLSSIQGAESELAKFLSGQRVQPQQLLQQAAEQITRAQIQKGVGALAEHFGFGSLPGVGAGEDKMGLIAASQKTPLNVFVKGGVFAPPSSTAGTNTLGAGIGAGEGAGRAVLNQSSNPALQAIAQFFSSFGGFRAAGGHTKSNVPYVVGEHGPELFSSSTSGKIIPNHELQNYMQNGFVFNPNSRDAVTLQYERYQRSLHQESTGSGLASYLRPLLTLSGTYLDKELGSYLLRRQALQHQTDLGSGAFPTLGGAGLGADAFPGLAGGGNVFAGRNYQVGESGPEIFLPDRAGSGRGGDKNTYITQNFNGVKDSDLFRRTARQEAARMFRNLK